MPKRYDPNTYDPFFVAGVTVGVDLNAIYKRAQEAGTIPTTESERLRRGGGEWVARIERLEAQARNLAGYQSHTIQIDGCMYVTFQVPDPATARRRLERAALRVYPPVAKPHRDTTVTPAGTPRRVR